VLDTRAYYICPRVNPDGAEWALADKPKIIRSGTRPYPYDEEPIGGLAEEDMDGDGRMLMMRVPDPNGAWKISDSEPRLMVPRDPGEAGGRYYRILPEGRIKDFDGVTIEIQKDKEGLDFNRNFPMEWRQEYEQRGAGPFPSSESEVHAVMKFIADHKNVTGGILFHTFSGVLLRPFSTHNDEDMLAEDLWTYKKIGRKGTELTGYPAASVYHEFRYHPKEVITGAFDDWLFDQIGVFAWTIEIWSPQKQAGIKEYKFIEWYREHSFEDDLTMLKWNDEKLGGKGYVDWYAFDHPQLGKVELGGWNEALAFRNPPLEFLEKELALFPDWLIWHLAISPKLEFYEASATPVGDGAYRVRVVVHNTGWLPTYVTKQALDHKVVRGVVCEIELPEGGTLASGKLREELSQLEGRAYKESAPVVWSADPTNDRAKVEWVVKAAAGSKVKVIAKHERAGTVRAEIELKQA
jgi:murein tripeptide amidase MpaA